MQARGLSVGAPLIAAVQANLDFFGHEGARRVVRLVDDHVLGLTRAHRGTHLCEVGVQ